MMDLQHPTNKKFNLFHLIDKHFRDMCHVLTVLKLAESHAHASIAAMLPYLLWQHAQSKPGPKASVLKNGLNQRHGTGRRMLSGAPRTNA